MSSQLSIFRVVPSLLRMTGPSASRFTALPPTFILVRGDLLFGSDGRSTGRDLSPDDGVVENALLMYDDLLTNIETMRSS
eukprot:CAMPEP_0171313634 /NCGR_PEP_ID=MMETSP0816-20121228/44500_1 /TAXON_ID=420281 /ORGANISM="Proboscia inermis, Strain CCAP1064/1" /LENGTH=79 /DNA_ID=CAMNT_0011801329 /DNA_START=525 /DNA_END=764 /DNA_ORIENTATION=-